MPFPEVFNQLKTLLKNLTPGKRITLLTLVGGIIASFIFLIIWAGSPDFQVLYSNLSPEDAGEILAKLKDQKIPYQISSNGRSVLIPKEHIYETRLELASKGLPQGSGVGFEIFDNTKLGMTEFVQNVNYQRACQGELSRTINGFTEVESSRVHIVMPSKSLFVEDEKPARASVVLKLRHGKCLSKNQIQGIVHLVSSSVSGLKPENVTIVDNHGKMLAGFKEETTFGQFTSDQLEFQEKVERGLENRIKTMLETALGPDTTIVRVSCALDFKRHEMTEELYDPDNRVVRSEQLLNENSNGGESIPGGIPGVAANLSEGNVVPTTVKTNSGFQRQDKTVNYEISKVTSHIVEPIGKINRVSVAVIVDGTYKLIKEKNGKEEWKYFPRTQEEMEKLKSIVKSAIIFDAEREDRVEVINIPFETAKLKNAREGIQEEDESPFWSFRLNYLKPIMKYSFMAFFLLFSFIFVVRPLVVWLTSSSHSDSEILMQFPKTVKELEKEYAGKTKSLPFRDRVLETITKNNEHSVKLVKDWLKER